jgi:transcriptional regulator with XRE-family HTH domain
MATRIVEAFPTSQTIEFNGQFINLSAIARECGVTPSHISRVFRNQTNPSIKLARQLCDLFEVSLDDLFYLIEDHSALK